jgi:DNA-binding LytR/AlgR family response regulator
MKFRFEKSEDKEEIVAYAKDRNELINLIEKICLNDSTKIIGYTDNIIKELNPNEIECFITTLDKVYAVVKDNKYVVKKRLYELNELLSNSFTFVNQGCLANLKKVDHFEASIGGSLLVVFKSGYKDYVSRRQLKNVKERMGIK